MGYRLQCLDDNVKRRWLCLSGNNSQYVVKDDDKEKMCKGLTLEQSCFDVQEVSVFVWGSNQGMFVEHHYGNYCLRLGIIGQKDILHFLLCTESKAPKKNTKGSRFFVPSIIRRTLRICPTVDRFFRKSFSVFRGTFVTCDCILLRSIA